MGKFDYEINNAVERISAVKRERAQEAASIAQTAENMFGAGELVQGLQAALAKRFSDQKLSASLGTWTKTANGAANKLTLKDAATGKERDIELEFEFGRADVMINRKIVTMDKKLSVLLGEIVNFFSEE